MSPRNDVICYHSKNRVLAVHFGSLPENSLR